MKARRFVQVTWDDAWHDEENFNTVHGIATTHAPMEVHTRGWLIQDDEVGISVASEESTQDGHEVFRGRTFIPRAMVKEVLELKVSKPRKPKELVTEIVNPLGT